MGGVTRTVPKKMRVLSSFANPLTRTTSVELGCLLTYKADIQKREKIRTEYSNLFVPLTPEVTAKFPALPGAASESWSQKNGIPAERPSWWEQDAKRVGASISASWAFAYCIGALGITCNAIPLSNTFRIDEFDFGAGYVQVMSDLLQSEGYIGEVDYNEELIIRNMATDDNATGPVLYHSDLINVGPINAGGIPANPIGVSYPTWKFKRTPDPNAQATTSAGGVPAGPPTEDVNGSEDVDSDVKPSLSGTKSDGTNDSSWSQDAKSNTSYSQTLNQPIPPDEAPGWEVTEEIGPKTAATAPYKDSTGKAQNYVRTYEPSSFTRTKYTYVAGRRVPEQTIQIRATILSAEAPGYIAAQIELGTSPDDYGVQTGQRTTYGYNSLGERTWQLVETFENSISLAGASNIEFKQRDGLVRISSHMILADKTYTQFLQAGNAECQVVTKWLHWLRTQSGQQAAARVKDVSRSKNDVAAFLNSTLWANVVVVDTTRQIVARSGEPVSAEEPTEDGKQPTVGWTSNGSGTRQEISGYEVPGFTVITNAQLAAEDEESTDPTESEAANSPAEEVAEIEWFYDGATEYRPKVLSMPYSSDDEVLPLYGGAGWRIRPSDAKSKALRYGRIQSRLTYGYRNGMELQISPAKMPGYAFAPLYISIDGLVAQYRVNNPSWVLTAGEAVASCNAIYWGVVGTT